MISNTPDADKKLAAPTTPDDIELAGAGSFPFGGALYRIATGEQT
jgi:hypothetical protein